MHQALVRLISLVPGFVPNFVTGPPAHVVASALVLSPVQVRSRPGLLVSFPEGMVSCRSGPVRYNFCLVI